MNMKVIATFFILWISFLAVVVVLGRNQSNPIKVKSLSYLEEKISLQPGDLTDEKLSENYPQLQKLTNLLIQLDRLRHRTHEIMRNPAPIYCKEATLEHQHCREDIQKLEQDIASLLNQWKAYAEHKRVLSAH